MSLLPVALYGLEVPSGDTLIDAVPDFPATFRITMAALDPSEPTEVEETTTGTVRPRATLKIVRLKNDQSEDDEDSEEYMRSLLADSDSSDDGGEEEEEINGGPSDPNKTNKARKTAALKQLMDSISGDASDEDMEDASSGTKADKKGKAKATSDGDEESEVDSDDDDEDKVEEFVLCTLDPEKNFQQPLDITVGEGERVYFKVSGTHTVYLTGNYLVPDDKGRNPHHEVYDSDEDEDYDLSPDEHELDMIDEDDSDHLDDLEDPRITEIGSGDEEQAPKLITATEKKGKNKRSADEIDEGTSLDDLMAKSLKSDNAEEPKLSKKQLKKLKKNNGEAAAAKNEVSKKAEAARAEKNDKKVQFAKNLEQGPTGTLDKTKPEASSAQGKVTLGVKTVDGVKIDDKKLGSGRACKKGDKVGMRYIGKLLDGKVFDANRKGPPFTFKLGAGEVIRGWDIGVAGMSVGGERRLTIPASKAYGNKSMGPDLPANSTLVFDIKLLEIK